MVIETNEYFDGRVRSLEFENSQGKFAPGSCRSASGRSTSPRGNG